MDDVIKYPQMYHNEATLWLEKKWNGYKLTEHERYIAEEIYNYARTKGEENEIKFLFDLGYAK